MKKTLCMILAICMLLALCACGTTNTEPSAPPTSGSSEAAADTTTGEVERTKLTMYLWSSSAKILEDNGVIADFESKYPYDVEITTAEFDELELYPDFDE